MWLPPVRVAFPLGLINEARHAAWILDQDSGGAETFVSSRIVLIVGEWFVWADVPLLPEYDALLRGRDPTAWASALAVLADERARDPLDDVSCQALCDGLRIGDEVPVC